MDNNNAYMRQYMLARYHRRRSEAISDLGGECALCGSVENLEIDHKDYRTKAFDLGKAFSGFSESRLKAELAKCWLLCSKCHADKTAVDQSLMFGRRVRWQHGTLGGYRYCRCAACKTAKREHNARDRLMRKAAGVPPQGLEP